MFKQPFSFDGRIRRTEYGISMILYSIGYIFVSVLLAENGDDFMPLLILFLIPGLWFMWAQGTKRCHDMGNSGWYQLIPFYGLIMLFQNGDLGANKYGENPKEAQKQLNNSTSPTYQNTNQQVSKGSETSYQGGYSGGHNNHNASSNPPPVPHIPEKSNSKGYKEGDLYN